MKNTCFWTFLFGCVAMMGCDSNEETTSLSPPKETVNLPAVSEEALEEDIRTHFEAQEFKSVLEDLATLRRLSPDSDLDSEMAHIEGQSLYQLAGAQWQQGLLEEAFGSLDRAARIFEDLQQENALANTLELKAVVAHEKGDLQGAETHYMLAGERYRSLGAQKGLGRVLLGQATIACERGTPSASVELLEEARLIFEEVEFRDGLGGVLIQDGIRLHLMGELADAKERYQTALNFLQEDKRYRASVLVNLGEVDLEMGQLGRALEIFRSARDLHRELQDPVWVAYSELRIVESLATLGRFSQAREIYRSIDLREVGDQIIQAQLAMARNRLSLYDSDFEEADVRSRQAIQVFQDYGRPDDLALAQLQFGRILAMQGQLEQAHRQLDATLARVQVTESFKVKAAHRRLEWVLRLQAVEPNVQQALVELQVSLGESTAHHHQLELFETLMATSRSAGIAQQETSGRVLQEEIQVRFAKGEFSELLNVLETQRDGHSS